MAFLGLVALLAVSCTSGAPETTQAKDGRTASPPTPTPDIRSARALPVGALEETATFKHAGEQPYSCPSPPESPLIPPDAACVSVIELDADGDEEDDRLVFYTEDEGAGDRVALLVLAAGGGDELRIDAERFHTWEPKGIADLDGTGGDEVLVHSAVGANNLPIWVLTFVDGRLHVVERADGDRAGERLRLMAGRGLNWARGYECRDVTGDGRPELIDHAAGVADEEREGWTLHSSVYAWEGPDLRLLEEREPQHFAGEWESDPRVDEIAGDRCAA